MSDEIILPSDPRAAQYKTVTGWVDRHGGFHGDDERYARLSGCSHRLCSECKTVPIRPITGMCSSCQEARDIQRFNAAPRKLWDGETMLYSNKYDRYFSNQDEALDFMQEHEITDIDVLRLYICEPAHLHTIDAEEWEGDLPEDEDLPAEVAVALAALNEAISQCGPVAWWPSMYAAQFDVSDIVNF